MTVCGIDACDQQVKAKDLCAKHYMRSRRAGDPTATRKPGRPRDRHRELLTTGDLAMGWSERTLTRYLTALRTLGELGGDEAVQTAIREATRPNGGSLNVAAVQRAADKAVLRYLKHENASIEGEG